MRGKDEAAYKISEGLPEPRQFFLDDPMYTVYEFNDTFGDALYIKKLEHDTYKLDLYCTDCRQNSVFESNDFPFGNYAGWGTSARIADYGKELYVKEHKEQILANRTFVVEFACARDENHIAAFAFRISNQSIMKIGQYPSIADIHLREIQKYRKILGDRYKEFAKAVGLSAHAVGIGSFVYLRRILEDLIEQAHKDAKNDVGWDEDGYARSRIIERIPLLSKHLPNFLVENRVLYGILSKGIHELNEDECIKHFPTMRIAIEMILDERILEQERKRKIADLHKKLGDISSDIKK